MNSSAVGGKKIGKTAMWNGERTKALARDNLGVQKVEDTVGSFSILEQKLKCVLRDRETLDIFTVESSWCRVGLVEEDLHLSRPDVVPRLLRAGKSLA